MSNKHQKHGHAVLDKPDREPLTGTLSEQIDAFLNLFYYGAKLNDDGTYTVDATALDALAETVCKERKAGAA